MPMQQIPAWHNSGANSGTTLKSLSSPNADIRRPELSKVSTVLAKKSCSFPAVVDELREFCFFDFAVVSNLLA
jgi:hypothetical protein